MHIRAVRTRIFKEGEDLVAFIARHVPTLKDGTVVVVTSKIVALSEGRTASAKGTDALIQRESAWSRKVAYGTLTLKDGVFMWNAGIDASNARGKMVLLPTDSFKIAAELRKELRRAHRIKKLGVLIVDSRIMPLRAGVVGVALGYAGFKGLRDYRGKKDIFGRALKYTRTDVADALASAAILVMGEGSERRPLCLLDEAPVEFCERVNRKELFIAPHDDMYRPLFPAALKKKRR